MADWLGVDMAYVTRPCSTCGIDYLGDSRSRHCSPDCKAEAARRRAAAWYAEQRDDPDLRNRVREGSRRHYEKVKADPDAWAERLTATARWRGANPDKVRESERAYWQANRDRKREKDHRRRARLLSAFVEDVSLSVLFARDGGMCGICKTAVDPDVPWPDKLSATIDHVIPLARGGSHGYENTQLAHAVCNSRKSDRLDYAPPA